MALTKFLKEEDITGWLDELSRLNSVLVPTQDGDAIAFRPFDKEKDLRLNRQATAPPKEAVFPQTETLLRFEYRKDPIDLSRMSVEVQETISDQKVIVFGSRPCGARGFTIYDRVYNAENIKDPYFKARRENTTFVSLACTRPENTCFCNSVGSGPSDPTGSDLLMVPVDGGYVVEAVTQKGEALLGNGWFSDAGEKAKEAEKIKKEAVEKMGMPLELEGASQKILGLFDNPSFWEDVSAKCISCGACTYLCPTCYCFNITDESSDLSGERIRTWDNCMSYLFTLEGSGHNPRPTKAHRLRNRVGHKFSYYPDIHEGIIACCGCGRCIKSCPVSVDIREIVLKAKEFKDE
jgi:ferredoxin